MNFAKKTLTLFLTVGIIATSTIGCSTKANNTTETDQVAVTPEVQTPELSQSKLDELTITHVLSPLNVPSIIQKNQSIIQNEFSNNGKEIQVNYAEITSGSEQTQALASGDVDILYAVGATSVILAAANGVDIKILNMYSRSPEAFALFSKDDTIKTAEDLKGKTVAGPVGTNLHQLLVAFLERSNMTIEDVNFVSMSIPDSKAALDSGSIDAALLAGPIAYKAKLQGHHLVTNGKGLTDAVIAVAVRKDFYEQYQAEIEVFMNAQARTIAFMKENHDEAMEIVAKELELDIAAVEEMFSQYDFNIEVTDADRQAFKNVADFMFKTDMIESNIDTNEIFINK